MRPKNNSGRAKTHASSFLESLETRLFLSASTQTKSSPTAYAPLAITIQPFDASDITVTQGGSPLTSGSSTVAFGTRNVGDAAPVKTFIVTNNGSDDLTIGTITLGTATFAASDPTGTITANGGTASFTIQMSTASAGVKSDTASFTVNDATTANTNTFSFSVSGQVNSPAAVGVVVGASTAVDDGDTVQFGTHNVGDAAASKTFTIKNTGDQSTAIGNVSVTPGGSAFTVTAQSSGPLAKNATTTFTVQMANGSAGAKTAQLKFTTDDPNHTTYTINVAGTVTTPAVGPVVRVTSTAGTVTDGTTNIAFGTKNVGDAAPSKTFTVFNDGDQPLTVGSVSITPGGSGFSLTTPFASPIAAGGSDTFTVQMSTASAGAKSATIAFTTNDPSHTTFDFTASGQVNTPAVGPKVRVTSTAGTVTDGTTSIAFGTKNVGDAAPAKTFTVFNDGDQPLTVGTVSITAGSGFTLTNPFASPIAAGGSDTFTVQMSTATAGAKSATISFTTNDPAHSTFDFTAGGQVNTPATGPLVRVTSSAGTVTDGTTSIAFGTKNVGDAAPSKTFTVFNDGDQPLTVGTVSITAGSGFTLTNPFASPIAAGGSDTFTVQMATTTTGAKTAAISFTTNDPAHTTFNFNAAGQVNAAVVGPVVRVTSSAGAVTDGVTSVAFGTRNQGDAPPSKTFTVFNDGDLPLTLGTVGITPGGSAFSVTNAFASPIAAGGSDTFTIQMDTGTAGAKTGHITFTTNDASHTTFDFTTTGQVNSVGTGPIATVLLGGAPVSSGSTVPFGTRTVGDVGPAKTFTVRNDGDSALTLSNASLPAGYSFTDPLPASIAAGATDTFTIRLDTTVAGIKNGNFSFHTNDPSSSTITFALTGEIDAPVTIPNIRVALDATVISDGASSPIIFTSVINGQTGASKIFKVTNTGTGALTISNLTLPAGFTLVNGLVGSIDPGDNDTFAVRLDSSLPGVHQGNVTFNTNVAGHATFNFAIKGTVQAPSVKVLRGTATMTSGDPTALTFGRIAQGSVGKAIIFKVTNTGDAPLTLTGLAVPKGFIVSDKLLASLAPAKSDTFAIRLDTRVAGLKTGTVHFNSNAPGQSPFLFNVRGAITGVTAAVDPHSASTLIVTGTGNSDKISFSGNSKSLTVIANGGKIGPFTNISHLVVNGNAGNDVIKLGQMVIPTIVNGGLGNDIISGGAGHDTFNGNEGDDVLTAGTGGDVLSGGSGRNTINAANGIPDKITSTGNDIVRADPIDSKK